MAHPQQEMCKQEFKRINEEIKTMNQDTKQDTSNSNKDQQDIHSKITALDSAVKSADRRIEVVEKHTEAVIRLSVSVDGVVKQVGSVISLYEGQNERIITLENKPAQTIYGYFKIGLTALVTGIVGLVLGFLAINGGA